MYVLMSLESIWDHNLHYLDRSQSNLTVYYSGKYYFNNICWVCSHSKRYSL